MPNLDDHISSLDTGEVNRDAELFLRRSRGLRNHSLDLNGVRFDLLGDLHRKYALLQSCFRLGQVGLERIDVKNVLVGLRDFDSIHTDRNNFNLTILLFDRDLLGLDTGDIHTHIKRLTRIRHAGLVLHEGRVRRSLGEAATATMHTGTHHVGVKRMKAVRADAVTNHLDDFDLQNFRLIEICESN
jgi:hypothetical protein